MVDMGSCSSPRLSRRSLGTDLPIMVKILELSQGQVDKDVMPLGQGAVYWQPPEEALEKVSQFAKEPLTSRYGTHEGLPELREALLEKLRLENKLFNSAVMVTPGSNQGFLNITLALCDVSDSVILFAPYFFNAYMTFKMTGINNILVGPSDPETLLPDADWLEKTLRSHSQHNSNNNNNNNNNVAPTPKMVSIVNPGNPSGTCIPHPLLQRISNICSNAGTWLVVDNAYEYFTYDGFKHECVEGKHVINLFSFSKSYGMMGWRVGYIAYWCGEISPDGVQLRDQLLKSQDNASICTPIISQRLALTLMTSSNQIGRRRWVDNISTDLSKNRALLLDVLSRTLGKGSVKGGGGAIYLWAKLPHGFDDDVRFVSWLATNHRVVVLPGTACGVPGFIRVTYGALRERECQLAATRLKKGLLDWTGPDRT